MDDRNKWRLFIQKAGLLLCSFIGGTAGIVVILYVAKFLGIMAECN